MTHILVFGDSIVWGSWDSKGGWAERLRMEINRNAIKAIRKNPESDYNAIYNLGIAGINIKNVLSRIRSETKARYYEGEENVIIFAVGTNDCAFLESKKNKNITSPDDFENTVRELIDTAKKIASKTIFLGITPVDEDKTNPLPWATDQYHKNDNVIQYNNILKKICAEKGAEFVDIYELFISSGDIQLLEDGLHPNTRGHKLIFDVVRKFLKEKNIL